uniref:Acyl-CoA dehydrogenase n=1 Tax=Myxococcus virescens TaxID=83456 RepID=A0A0N7ATF7_9BACT|nr:acyl-CoA dehydrogenase [Myxococcus virescens]
METSKGHAAAPEVAGVVGAGLMGAGVAHRASQYGMRVVLIDEDEEALERARQSVRDNARLAGLFVKGGAPTPVETILSGIRFTKDYDGLAEADIVVECVTEKWPIKRELFRRLGEVCRPDAVFASNTSAIPITRLASATSHPERVVGMHFMNPVHLKSFVEMAQGYHTSERTLQVARAFAGRMGMETVTVQDAPGFVTNRILMLTVNEAVWAAQDGVAPPADIDRIFKGCFGHRMGPLETADLIGLDTILLSLEVLQESFGDPKFRPCPLLKKKVDAGLLGRKSGEGFYKYAAANSSGTPGPESR